LSKGGVGLVQLLLRWSIWVTSELRFNRPVTKNVPQDSEQNTLDILINKVAVVGTMMGRSLQEYETPWRKNLLPN
jgi:hypothetical protein